MNSLELSSRGHPTPCAATQSVLYPKIRNVREDRDPSQMGPIAILLSQSYSLPDPPPKFWTWAEKRLSPSYQDVLTRHTEIRSLAGQRQLFVLWSLKRRQKYEEELERNTIFVERKLISAGTLKIGGPRKRQSESDCESNWRWLTGPGELWGDRKWEKSSSSILVPFSRRLPTGLWVLFLVNIMSWPKKVFPLVFSENVQTDQIVAETLTLFIPLDA